MTSKLNILKIDHQDGIIEFSLTNGGYSIENNCISISIETDSIDEDAFPPCANICIVNHPIKDALRVGDSFEFSGGMNRDPDEAIKACGYFTFHADHIFVKWTVVSIDKEHVVFRLESNHDDVNYYDSRAKQCPTNGQFSLSLKKRSALWIPS